MGTAPVSAPVVFSQFATRCVAALFPALSRQLTSP
jgi:hypothetical protein